MYNVNKIVRPGGANPVSYDDVNRPQESQETGTNFSDVFGGAMREQATQSIMERMNGLGGSSALGGFGGLNGLGGPDMMSGVFMPSATAGMENTLIAVAEQGEMSGPQLLLFMMLMMMQTGDSGGDLAPIIQMVSHMLTDAMQPSQPSQPPQVQQYGDIATGPQNNMLNPRDMEPGIKSMVDIALEQVGYHEKNRDGSRGRGNFTQFGAWYGMDGQPWCAMFVSWAADRAGMLNNTVPKHASTSRGAAAYKEKGLYATRASGYIPREGDAIYFSRGGRMFHVGIVVAFDPETNRVYTVEGNTDNAVRIRHYDINNPRIDGYGRNGGTDFGRVPINSTSGTGANTN